jgi:hypothetical protein
MATRKNTRTSTRSAAPTTSYDPLGEYQGVTKKVEGLSQLDRETWAEFNKFVSEQGPAVVKKYGLKNRDLGGGLAIAAWLASLVEDAERASQPRVDAAIRHLDPSIRE